MNCTRRLKKRRLEEGLEGGLNPEVEIETSGSIVIPLLVPLQKRGEVFFSFFLFSTVKIKIKIINLYLFICIINYILEELCFSSLICKYYKN